MQAVRLDLPGSATPAERYPIIDITGKDMQPFLQTLPIPLTLACRNCRLGKVEKYLEGRIRAGPFDR